MSAETICRDELVEQFNRAWDMVIQAVERLSDANWTADDDGRYTPARVAYHLLKAAERYTYVGDPEEYLKQQRFNKDWVEALIAELPSRDQCPADLRAMKSRTAAWLGEGGKDGLTGSPAKWPWVGKTLLGQAVYFLRHTQHHQAELNAALKRLGRQPVKWK